MRSQLLIGTALLFLASACGDPKSSSSSSGDGGSPPPDYDADLTILTVVASPLAIDVGHPLSVTDIVRNQGNEAVPGFRVGIYLSADATVDTGDVLLGFRSISSLAAQSQDAGGGELTVPMGTAAGTYWIGAVADDLDQVGETDEDNNVTVFVDTIEVSAPPLPDLVPTGVTFSPPAVDAGQTIQVDDAIENQGEANSGPFQVGFYLSTDTQVTTADILLGVRQVVDLAPGSGDSGTGTLTVPQQTPPGVYYVGVIVDDADDVFEQSEVNNQLVAGAVLQVKQPPLPDLVPSEMNFTPNSVQAGDSIYVTEGVLNQGIAPAESFLVSVYLSADPLVDSTDILLAYRGVAFLGDGQSDKVSAIQVQIPPETPEGTYWVGVWADSSDVVHEPIEANNVLMAVGTLAVGVPPLPNLEPLQCSFSPGVVNVDDGDLLTVVEEVVNTGAVPSGSFRVGVYLSTNSVVTPSDLLLHSRVITTLNPGVSSGATNQIQVPTGISDGSYFIGVFVDDLSEQGEISEGDNVLLAEGTLDVVSTPDPEPDLIMEQCDYNGLDKAPGETFQVVTKVTNEGNLSAAPFHVGIYLSVDSEIGPDDVLLGERNLIGGLSAGFSNISSAPVTIPAGQAEGTYYLGAYADNALVVAESEEDDNDFTTPGVLVVEIPPPPAPELYVKSADHDGGANEAGDVITFDDVVRNQGELDAESPFRVGYYLSDDNVLDAADTLLATRVITSLAKGEEDAAQTLVTIPPGTPPGTYWLGLIVDDQQAITENDEDDNFEVVLPAITIQ